MSRDTSQLDLFSTNAPASVVDVSEPVVEPQIDASDDVDDDPRPEGWPEHLAGPKEMARRQKAHLEMMYERQRRRGERRRAQQGSS